MEKVIRLTNEQLCIVCEALNDYKSKQEKYLREHEARTLDWYDDFERRITQAVELRKKCMDILTGKVEDNDTNK